MQDVSSPGLSIPSTRALPRINIGGLAGISVIYLFLIVFLIFPLICLFYDAFTTDEGVLTINNFYQFFTNSYYLHAIWRSILLGLGTVATTSFLGIIIAYLLIRYDFPGRGLFTYLTIFPIIMPPLVGVMGFVFILGRAGTVNVLLMDYLGLAKPINFMYGIHGVLLVETLHLFPLMTLSIVDALSKIDPFLEEAAESVGATKMRTFRDVTLPLIWKGVLVGSLYSFILALQEASATLILTIPGKEVLTVGIFNFYTSGSRNEAAALGFILLVLGGVCLFAINKIAGASKMGGVFG